MLDITAFSNALLAGNVSFLQSLNLHPMRDDTGDIVHFRGEDAVVYPLGAQTDTPTFALRMPLEYQTGRAWPGHYADLASAGGTIHGFLPTGMTILDVDDIAEPDVALLYDWMPGETLTSRIARCGDRQQRDQLAELLWPLADIGEAIRVSGMVHGDIAPGNIVVRPDGSMGLIDLDRASLRGSEQIASPRRRPGYRLPRGGGSAAEEDAFGLLVLMATCGILADSNVLIDHDPSGGEVHPTMLFSSWDLMDPQRSRIVREVGNHLSPLSKALLDFLVSACTGSADRSPSLLRDAIQEVRRSGAKPASDDALATQAPYSWWVDEARGQIQPDVASAVEHDQADGIGDSIVSGWSVVEKPQPIGHQSGWNIPNERSPREIVADIQATATAGMVDNTGNRRTVRAERRRQHVSDELRKALDDNDRRVLVRLAMSGALAELGDPEREDLLKVLRALAHDSIARAIASDDDGVIVASVDDSVFESDRDLDPAFRSRVALARQRVRWSDDVLDAVSRNDGRACVELLANAPDGAAGRLSDPVRSQARRLADQMSAESDTQRALADHDPNRLAAALGRLVQVRPAWTDCIDIDDILDLLGASQIEQRLVAKLSSGNVNAADQWMVDIVVAVGRMPDAVRSSGLSSSDVDRLLHRR